MMTSTNETMRGIRVRDDHVRCSKTRGSRRRRANWQVVKSRDVR